MHSPEKIVFFPEKYRETGHIIHLPVGVSLGEIGIEGQVKNIIGVDGPFDFSTGTKTVLFRICLYRKIYTDRKSPAHMVEYGYSFWVAGVAGFLKRLHKPSL